MTESITRVGGSGWTQIIVQGRPLILVQSIEETAPSPVASPQVVQPIDSAFPLEIVTPRAFGAGTLRVTKWEKWDGPVWRDLPGFESTWSLYDIFTRQAKMGNVTARKIFKTPTGSRYKNYTGITITNVDDSERIELGTMLMPKSITMMYTKFEYSQ